MNSFLEITAVILFGLGSFFTLLAAVGIVRMPDFYCRLSATSKAAPFGVGLVLAGASLVVGDPAFALQAVAVAVFVAITLPVAAHVLARSALRGGVPFGDATTRE